MLIAECIILFRNICIHIGMNIRQSGKLFLKVLHFSVLFTLLQCDLFGGGRFKNKITKTSEVRQTWPVQTFIPWN